MTTHPTARAVAVPDRPAPRPGRATTPVTSFDCRAGVGTVLARAGSVLGYLTLGVLWVLRPVLVLVARVLVAVVWTALAVVVALAVAGRLPSSAGTGSGWDRMGTFVQTLTIAFPLAVVAVLVFGQVTHIRRRATWTAHHLGADLAAVDLAEVVEDGPVTVTVLVYGWACPGCREISTTPARSLPEAVHLAGVHDRVWHGGAPTAQPITATTSGRGAWA